MKLLRCGELNKEKPAVMDNAGIIRDISSIVNDFDPKNISENLIKKINETAINKLPEIKKNTRVGACISNPQKFIGIGLNYADHAKEQNLPEPKEPIIFFKASSCICGPHDEIYIPKNSEKTDWEVELGFVVSKKTKNIEKEESLDHILGFFLVTDFSERDWQKKRGGGWSKGKSADTFGPIGPYIIPVEELSNFQNLNMFLDVNKERMQTGNTNDMIFNIEFLLSYLSNFMTLYPGDIITTGTPPGVGENKKPPKFLKKGDKVRLGIDKLGEQNHTVI